MDKERLIAMKLAGLTYTQIGKEFGLSRQRIQQLLRPPKGIADFVVARAVGKCEDCGIWVGFRGDMHHKNAGPEENFNDVENLVLLCRSCHIKLHPTLKDLWLRIKGRRYRCLRCGHEWIGRKPYRPKFCAKCRSLLWDREPPKGKSD